jgi:hypothetical protein
MIHDRDRQCIIQLYCDSQFYVQFSISTIQKYIEIRLRFKEIRIQLCLVRFPLNNKTKYRQADAD